MRILRDTERGQEELCVRIPGFHQLQTRATLGICYAMPRNASKIYRPLFITQLTLLFKTAIIAITHRPTDSALSPPWKGTHSRRISLPSSSIETRSLSKIRLCLNLLMSVVLEKPATIARRVWNPAKHWTQSRGPRNHCIVQARLLRAYLVTAYSDNASELSLISLGKGVVRVLYSWGQIQTAVCCEGWGFCFTMNSIAPLPRYRE